MTPREFFPKMPDEVYDMWLAPIAAEYGWPFQSIDDSLDDTKWKYVLGRIPLTLWHSFEWNLRDINLAVTPPTEGSAQSVMALIQRCVHGTPTLYAGVAGSEERFRACADFIMEHGHIPKPIVGLIRSGRIDIVDGNHRIAALLHMKPKSGFIVQAWLPCVPNETK